MSAFLKDIVRDAREKKGMSRQQLADASGYSQSAISDIETGKVTRPSAEKRHKLADALGISVDMLLDASRRASVAKGRVRMPRTQEDVLFRRRGRREGNPASTYAETVAPYAASIRMIREAIEEIFGPAANLESEEAVLLRGPELHHDAEAIIAALQRVAEQHRREE